MTAVIGIDPGVRGGLAILAENGHPLHVQAFDPKMTQKEIVAAVDQAVLVLLQYGGWECWVEKVGYMPGDGGKGANTFGRVDGILRGAVLALKLEMHDVAPMLWQARLECLSGGNKNVTKNKALQLFAGRGVKITHATADALLIAEFGRLTIQARRTKI